MAKEQSSNQTTATTSSKASPEAGLTDVASVRDYLHVRINPTVVSSLNAKLRLAWPANPAVLTAHSTAQVGLGFELTQGQLVWLEDNEPTQATFWFRDAQDVGHLLSGSDNAYVDFMERFMAAELSSDGYLPWAFTLLSLFRGGPSLTTPS